jgi:hypothetical protein
LPRDTIAQWWQFKADDPIVLQVRCSSHDVPIDAWRMLAIRDHTSRRDQPPIH